jgi:hypothetical protein
MAMDEKAKPPLDGGGVLLLFHEPFAYFAGGTALG